MLFFWLFELYNYMYVIKLFVLKMVVIIIEIKEEKRENIILNYIM